MYAVPGMRRGAYRCPPEDGCPACSCIDEHDDEAARRRCVVAALSVDALCPSWLRVDAPPRHMPHFGQLMLDFDMLGCVAWASFVIAGAAARRAVAARASSVLVTMTEAREYAREAGTTLPASSRASSVSETLRRPAGRVTATTCGVRSRTGSARASSVLAGIGQAPAGGDLLGSCVVFG